MTTNAKRAVTPAQPDALPLPFCTCGRYCPRHAYGDGILYMGCDECDTGLVYTTAHEKPRRFALAVVERTIRLRAEVNNG